MAITQPLKAPFPWFGGKSRVAHLVWERFGSVKNYVEPFFGSGAVLLGRPDWEPGMTETVNDLDALLCNFWRAVKRFPEAVAFYADEPAIENDLHAKNYQLALSRGELRKKLESEPDGCDPELAGWWVWGIGLWIGGEWATLCGPWTVEDGLFVKRKPGSGVKRQLPDTRPKGVFRKVLNLSSWGVQRRLIHLSSGGQGVHNSSFQIPDQFQPLSHRLRNVRICSGDWKRLTGQSVTTKHGLTGFFLDSPYREDETDTRCFAMGDNPNPWPEVWPWAIENGNEPLLRIAVCGYEGEPHGSAFREAGWDEVAWTAQGGYGAGLGGRGEENRHRERIWFSPHCLKPAEQLSLFGGVV